MINISATVPLARLACGCNCCAGIPIRNLFTAVPELLLDLHPPAGNPCGIPCVIESDRFRKELTESQFLQRSRYPGNPENKSREFFETFQGCLTQNHMFTQHFCKAPVQKWSQSPRRASLRKYNFSLIVQEVLEFTQTIRVATIENVKHY